MKFIIMMIDDYACLTSAYAIDNECAKKTCDSFFAVKASLPEAIKEDTFSSVILSR